MVRNRLWLWTLLLVAEPAFGDRDDIKQVLAADPALHNLKACGSCKIVSLPDTTPCWYTTAVVYASGCQSMGCLCDGNYRQKRTKWIGDEVQSLCGIKDTITPQATVDWFNTFCDAQLAILAASSPTPTLTTKTNPQSPGSTGTGVATPPAAGGGSGGTTISNGQGTVVNCPNSQECNVGVTGSVNSHSPRLDAGLISGLGVLFLVAMMVFF